MMVAAVDLFDQGNWFSVGLQGLRIPTDLFARVGMGAASYSESSVDAQLNVHSATACTLGADATVVMCVADISTDSWSSAGLAGLTSPIPLMLESAMHTRAGVKSQGMELLDVEMMAASVLGVDVILQHFPIGDYDTMMASPGLAGCRSPVEMNAQVTGHSSPVVKTDPYQVVSADVTMGTRTGSATSPVVGGIAYQSCEPLRLRLSVQAHASSVTGLSTNGYSVGQATLCLGGGTVTSVSADVVLHPFCCDWSSMAWEQPADHTNANLWVEAMTNGEVTFQVGDFELESCGCTGTRPVWKSGVAWSGESSSALYVDDADVVEYGHVRSVSMFDMQMSAYAVTWLGLEAMQGVSLSADAIALSWVPTFMQGTAGVNVGVNGVQIDFMAARGRSMPVLGVNAWVVQWPAISSQSGVVANGHPVSGDDRVHRLSIPRFMARSYSPVHIVEIAVCEQAVFALHDGGMVEDIVEAWPDTKSCAEVGHTRNRITVRSAQVGELLLIKVLRASGQVAEFKVKVS